MRAKLKIFIDTPAWFVRPKNTDWRYMRQLKALEQFVPVEMIYPSDALDAISESVSYFAGRLGLMAKAGSGRYLREGSLIDRAAADADILLCHRQFPKARRSMPTVWQHCVLDPHMQMSWGRSMEEIEADYVDQNVVYQQSAAVQMSTQAEADRHAARFPDLAARFRAVPFFLPHISTVPEDEVRAKHHEDGALKILFVGREGERKGLDLLVEGYLQLPEASRIRCELVVVSSQLGNIKIPENAGIRWHASLPRPQVLSLMRAAHIYAMPSRFESFGFTYLEAMAAGCALVASNWEVQSEILDYGHAGWLVTPTADAVSAALAALCGDPNHRLKLALAARERFLSTFSPAAVARAYHEMFVSIV